MQLLTQSKNNNVVSLTDAEFAALSVPSVKIETVERDDAYGKNFADMSGEDFYHTLQFHYHAATCGKISADKFRVILRDVFSYLDAHNISIADNNLELDNKTAFKTAAQILHNYCDEYICCLLEPRIVTFEGTNCGAYTCIAQLIESIANKTDSDPVAIAEVILRFFKEGKNNAENLDK